MSPGVLFLGVVVFAAWVELAPLVIMYCNTFLVPSVVNYWCHLHKFLGSLVEDKKMKSVKDIFCVID